MKSSKGLFSGSCKQVFGIQIADVSISRLSEIILSRDLKTHIHLVAASTVTEAHSDSTLKEILNNGIALCDSKPLSLWLSGRNKLEQIRGTDLLKSVLYASNTENLHYFLGGSEKTREVLIKRIQIDFPNAKVVGSFSPPFCNPTIKDIHSWASDIAITGANLIWVGLGSPKQDYVSFELFKETNKTVIAVGAAFDFLAGTTPEAPRLIQKIGLEWMFRLLSEPKRLWRRYTIGNMKFIIFLIRERLKL